MFIFFYSKIYDFSMRKAGLTELCQMIMMCQYRFIIITNIPLWWVILIMAEPYIRTEMCQFPDPSTFNLTVTLN